MLKRTGRIAVVPVVLAAALIAFLAGCDRPDRPRGPAEPSPDSAGSEDELAPIAAIGGVRDVWAFDFGLDADRERVRVAFGDPREVEESDATEVESGPQIVRWEYDGLRVNFLIDRADEHEYLLSLRITDPELPLRGGLELGMSVDAATELLGAPRVRNEESLVYFYRETTIELAVSDGTVTAVTLARALP